MSSYKTELRLGSYVLECELDTAPATFRIEFKSSTLGDAVTLRSLYEEGRVVIRLLDETGQQIDPSEDILDSVVFLPISEPSVDVDAVNSQNSQVKLAWQELDSRKPGSDEKSPIGRSVLPKRLEVVAEIELWMDALGKAQAHAGQHLSYEVGGIVMGIPRQERATGKWTVEITDTFIAKYTVNRGASITFTPDTWSAANRVIDQEYADGAERMVGWYHTHPGYGIFLSSFDLFIHESFFTQPWHIALVVDPINRSWGFFGWQQDGLKVVVKECKDIKHKKGAYRRPPTRSSQATEKSVESPPEAESPISLADDLEPGASPKRDQATDGGQSILTPTDSQEGVRIDESEGGSNPAGADLPVTQASSVEAELTGANEASDNCLNAEAEKQVKP